MLPVAAENVPDEQPKGPWHRWSSIRLKVKAMPLLSGRIWMHVDPAESTTRFETESNARFLGARVASSETVSLLDNRSGQPKWHTSRSGKKARRFTFGEKSYRYEKLRTQGDARAPLDGWEVRRSVNFDYPLDAEGKPLPVYDYYGMLLQLRRAPLKDIDDEATFHVATSEGVKPFRVRVVELRAGTVSWRALPESKQVRSIVQQMRLSIEPLSPGEDQEGFLNMEGETELWVERHSKTVLRIGGKARKVPGKIALVLAEMG